MAHQERPSNHHCPWHRIHLQKGGLKKHWSYLRETLRQSPENLEALKLSGALLLKTSKMKGTIKLLDKAAKLDTKDAVTLLNLGMALMALRT